ncbi:MAG: hypothetical protein CVU54_16125 [Deltaproteobacteria bacterium HGW-Deltaproteobacteria-12]|nr:MAG: hypothetical protein CVU54_16125 [Deltaproteobacteria bacterium HGW-Deltaproteobacteria-12]
MTDQSVIILLTDNDIFPIIHEGNTLLDLLFMLDVFNFYVKNHMNFFNMKIIQKISSQYEVHV